MTEQQNSMEAPHYQWPTRIAYFLLFFVAESAVFAIIPLSIIMPITGLLAIHSLVVVVAHLNSALCTFFHSS